MRAHSRSTAATGTGSLGFTSGVKRATTSPWRSSGNVLKCAAAFRVGGWAGSGGAALDAEIQREAKKLSEVADVIFEQHRIRSRASVA